MAKDAVETNADDDNDDEREDGSDDDAGSHGYTPSPVRAKAGAGSSASPTRPQNVASAKRLTITLACRRVPPPKEEERVVQWPGFLTINIFGWDANFVGATTPTSTKEAPVSTAC